MAQISYPLDNTYYTAENAQLWLSTRTRGVYSSDDLAVMPTDGMIVEVNPGIAWLKFSRFSNAVYGNTDTVQLTHNIADSLYSRVDRIVVRWDNVGNNIYLAVKTGTPSVSPIAPAIREDDDVVEIAIADVTIRAGAIQIVSGDIADKRLDENVCGIMRDGVTGIPTQELYDQFIAWESEMQSDFTAWIATLKDILDEETAGHLQLEIENLQEDVMFLESNMDDNFQEKGVQIYTHMKTGTMHNFSGSGPNGRALITAEYERGDTFAVNGVACAAYTGGEEVDNLFLGHWMTFVYDGNQMDFGGGGAGVKYDIVVVGGAVRPTDPDNNTIWINTTQEIGKVSISPIKPITPADGDVWITHGSSGQPKMIIAPSAPKIELMLGICHQWADNAWQGREAFGFVGDAWQELALFLYNYGWLNEDAVGAFDSIQASAPVNYGVEYRTDCMHQYAQGNNPWCTSYSRKRVDVTNYSTMTIRVISDGYTRWFGLTSVPPTNAGDAGYVVRAGSTVWGKVDTTYTIDISALSGLFYVAMSISQATANWGYNDVYMIEFS